MAYSDITFNDSNKVKSWLQKRRLHAAVEFCREFVSHPVSFCDFGAGNGELCKCVSDTHPNAQIVCYDPTPALLAEARLNLSGVGNVSFIADSAEIPSGSADVLFCLEVFEHLPEKETNSALREIERIINDSGVIIIGVPIEIGVPAFYKGMFRMARRRGAFDAQWKHILGSLFLSPPTERPVAEIAPNFNFYFDHMGFDYRHLRDTLAQRFALKAVYSCPFKFPSFVMPEVYLIASKRTSSAER